MVTPILQHKEDPLLPSVAFSVAPSSATLDPGRLRPVKVPLEPRRGGRGAAPAGAGRSQLTLWQRWELLQGISRPALTRSLSPGFVQVGGDTRLVAVQGPVPTQPSCCEAAASLPAAFTSAATHFKPIVLTPDAGDAR